MAVRVDLEQKTVTASIRDLAEPPDGSRGLGLPVELRAELGRRIHTKYGHERAHAHFESEVPLELSRQIDGFTARLRGRVDGLIDDGKTLIAEEAKSVALTAKELRTLAPSDVPDHCLQVLLYALCLRQSHPDREVKARLVLCSLHSSARHVLDVPFDETAILNTLDGLLRAAIAEERARRVRAAKRCACSERLKFPYSTLRPHQQRLIDLIAGGLAAKQPVLAMAPTGLGKTVAALLAGLRFSLRQDATLFYATAKRTQQELVSRTFRDLCAASGLGGGELGALTLRAKERMCPPGNLLCDPDACPFLVNFTDRLNASGAADQLLAQNTHITPDAIYQCGEKLQLCPFELSMRLAARAELVIGDYNYVYDRAAGAATESEDSKSVVIIDEAHNLFDRAREYDSPFLSREVLLESRKGIRATGSRARKDSNQMLLNLPEIETGPKLFTALSRFLSKLLACIDERIEEAKELGLSFVEGCAAIERHADTWQAFAEDASRLFVEYVLHNRVHRVVQREDPLLDVLRTVLRIRDLLSEPAEEYVPYAALPAAPSGAGLGVLCVNPARRLAEHHRRAVGTVAMSATLTPLSYYRDVLGFGELDAVADCVPSPFPRENREIVVVPTVDTSFRSRARHYASVARLIADVVRVRPGCYAAFFPSFDFLAAVQAQLDLPAADVLIQKPDMSEDARRQTLDELRSANGARLLLAVMGGVLAEGIDLPGEALVGAIIVSPGLPKIGFERDQMRRYFDAQDCKGFAYAMLYPGMQRVIQSAGRVIRSMEDRGVIVLLCRRFAQAEYVACLPPDWRPDGIEPLLVRDPAPRLRSFWSGSPT